ncbi:MAG TPA: aldehyde ferredoxin oxidoreductase C-terminal domain-containing protein [Candidatus Limnocylindrales bacterium]|nr:aldehyde ferredoxin oxidoreductase C-terminal domain-containing protein [Candidatus Limnocylindrales bacterium]
MMLGYAGKFLEVDLSKSSCNDVTFPDEWLRDYIGGRALAAKIMSERLLRKWEKVDPLGPENILFFMSGPFTGYFPGGRTCVTGKSPQSNGMVGSTVGGEFPVELRCAGYDGIIVSGRAEKPVYLFIKDNDVEIRDAERIWGKDGKQTEALLNRECRKLLSERYPRVGVWKEPAKLYIGPAGENRVRPAAVIAKWTHAAGYGGYGAVMGSKNLKGVAVKGTGPLPEVADIEKLKQMIDEVCKGCYGNTLWRRWGTGGGGYSFGAETSSEPVRNWQEEWHDERSYGVDQFENRVWVKPAWSDFGCPTNCLKISCVHAGKYKGAISDNPDYELQAFLGPNLGVFTPEENVYLSSLIEDLGFCGIQGGSTLGFAAELYQRGIITKEDLGGLELKWGDAEAFAALAKKIACREGMGDVLAEGAHRAAIRLGELKGVNLMPYAVTGKGISIGAHGIRSGRDFSREIGYACSVQGGDHSSMTDLPIDGWGSEIWQIFNDSAVMCIFTSFNLSPTFRYEFYYALTGQTLSRKGWLNGGGIKTLQIQRAMLLLGGPDLRWNPMVDDDNPARFYEPLPTGPCKGQSADKTSVREKVRQYYDEAGWDQNGVPASEELRKLGLEYVDESLKRLRS